MKLAALTMTKIESDIIEEFVRHTLRFVDRVIVVDNGSIDAARVILTALVAEGLPVSIWEGQAVPSNSDVLTPFARHAFAEFDTDYLLMLDVDEFIRAPSRSSLEETLVALGGAHGLVPWVTYVPTPDDDANEVRVLARIGHRLCREARPFSKVFVHRSFMDQSGGLITLGNHGVLNSNGSAPSRALPDVQLAHFPVRSLRQIQSKALIGWPAIIAMGFGDQQTTSYQWRHVNERLLNDPNWDAEEFFRCAWHYLDGDADVGKPELVLDPLPLVERRYPQEPPELLALSMAFTRQLARAYATRPPNPEHNARKMISMIDIAHTDNHVDDRRAETGAPPPTYGEAYFKHYHTGLGMIAYERNPHWLGFFATVADEIVRVFRPDSVLDAGCALGILVESLWDRGVKAQGIDISRYAIDNVRHDMRSHCRVASLTEPIEGTFDLVTCIEVLEHLESADAEAAIANICNVTDTVLFSSTPSDFDEPTHVNVCPPIVWIELFAKHGFGPDLLADGTFLTSHTMVFRKGSPCDIEFLKTYAMIVRNRVLCAERLEAIAVERNASHVARQAQILAEQQMGVEARLHAETRAALQETRAAEHVAREACVQAEARAASEAERYSQALAALEMRTDAERQASLQRFQVEQRSEILRCQIRLRELQQAFQEIEGSRSWRLTRPIRIVGRYARKTLSRLKRRSVPAEDSDER